MQHQNKDQKKEASVSTSKYNPETHGIPTMNESKDTYPKPEIEEPEPHRKIEEPIIANKQSGKFEKEAGYKHENGNPTARKKEDIQNDAGMINDEPVEQASHKIGSKEK